MSRGMLLGLYWCAAALLVAAIAAGFGYLVDGWHGALMTVVPAVAGSLSTSVMAALQQRSADSPARKEA